MHDNKILSRVEITALFGFQRSTFASFRKNYPQFPKPVSARANAPLFNVDDVAAFLFEHAPHFLTKTPDGLKYAALLIHESGLTK